AAAVQTNFVRNGFGDVIQEVSPDRGTVIYHYDAAGDLEAAVDGRGQRVAYNRDLLRRIIRKLPVGRPSAETVTYTYDSNTLTTCWCLGRLATMTDASGTTRFGYDHRGNYIGKNIVGVTVATLALQYDLADRITQVRTATGR